MKRPALALELSAPGRGLGNGVLATGSLAGINQFTVVEEPDFYAAPSWRFVQLSVSILMKLSQTPQPTAIAGFH